jgi:uncharacterized protein (DUF1501 family)
MEKHSRRDFLVRSASLVALGLAAPAWLSSIARADLRRAAAGLTGGTGNRTLVVCQFSGGNDGLNTVIPYVDKAYYNLRPTLAIPEAQQLPLSEQLALHPSLKEVRELYAQQRVAIVNGVGYQNPNRSHFASMSIWQSGDPSGKTATGWLGRYLDTQGDANPVLALSLGNGRVEALQGTRASVPTFASLEDVRAMVGDADAERALRALQGGSVSGRHGTVKAANDTALNAMDALAAKLGEYTPSANYGSDAFGQGLRNVVQLLAVSPGTRVVYMSVGGFDTHARQQATHAELLAQFSAAAAEFNREIVALGRGAEVTLLAFSEFGRRAAENGSAGTDHGAAAPVMLLGGVNAGLYGQYPSLTDLEHGDLKHSTDFRQVYASALQWLGADSGAILNAEYGGLPLFA